MNKIRTLFVLTLYAHGHTDSTAFLVSSTGEFPLVGLIASPNFLQTAGHIHQTGDVHVLWEQF